VFFSLGVTLDGFIAGPNAGPSNPLGDQGALILAWAFEQRAFRAHLKLGEGGETGVDNRVVEHTIARTGATILGKRTFDEGEPNWPEEAPFRSPVFVLTHAACRPSPRPGGTTFHFVNDGIESALRQARAAAGEKDVRIGGGAETVMQYLNAGLIDDFALSIAPFFMGRGVRLFDASDARKSSFEVANVLHSKAVAHLKFVVTRK
jgi:dihydrofolate reductase